LLKQAHQEILSIIDDMNTKFIDRKNAINGIMTGIIANRHILMLGVPGLSKSEFAVYLVKCLGIPEDLFVDKQFHSQITYNDLFGNYDFELLATTNKFERVKHGTFRSARAVNLDELFKGNRASLTPMLRFLNEGTAEENGIKIKLPIEIIIASSNEIPSPEDGLEALFDRFLYKIYLRKISKDNDFRRLLTLPEGIFDNHPVLSVPLADVRQDAAKVTLGASTLDTYSMLFAEVAKTSVFISDRTWRKSTAIVKAAAWLAGRDVTQPEDMIVLGNVLWTRPEDIPVIERLLAAVCFPQLTEIYDIIDECNKLLEPVERVSVDRNGSVSKGHPIPKEFIDYRDRVTTNIPSQEVQGVAQAVNRTLKDRVSAMKNKIAGLPASCDITGITDSFDKIDKARMDNVRALSELNGI